MYIHVLVKYFIHILHCCSRALVLLEHVILDLYDL